jgi:molybdate transport system ATP-binding protein
MMTVTDIDRHPERVRARLNGPIPLLAELTPSGAEALALTVGDTIWASVKASEVTVTPDLGT